jgi:hypothetical protein
MEHKIKQFLQDNNTSNATAEGFLNYLSFSDSEINDVESATVDQWECSCEPNNPRDWGLLEEEEARKCYIMSVAGKQHNKIRLEQ